MIVFKYGEIGLLKVVDRVPLRVGDNDIEDGDRDSGAEDVFRLAGGLYGACLSWNRLRRREYGAAFGSERKKN